MASKTELLESLDELKEVAAEGTKAYQRSRDFLYKGLVGTYLWWLEAKKIDGFLEELYKNNNLPTTEDGAEEKFTRILRIVWQLDWTPKNAPKLQQWSLVLRELDKEYTNNKAAYKTGAEQKLYNVIDGAGGIRKYIGADKYVAADLESAKQTGKKDKKNRQQIFDGAKIREKHIELGKSYFAQKARTIVNIETEAAIPTTAEGYTLALLRKSPNSKTKYAVLATLSDINLVDDSIVRSYRVSKDDLQPSLRLLTEIILTQSIPEAMEAFRWKMQDTLTFKNEAQEKFKWTQNKRLLFRKRTSDILLSESRSECSVVTVVTPKVFPIKIDGDTFLRINDRTFLENEIIQPRNQAIVEANYDDAIPEARVDAAHTHVLETTNKVTGRKRNLYFYPLANLQDLSQTQADINDTEIGDVIWSATVDKIWLEYLNAIFVNSWIDQEGIKYNFPKNKVARIEFNSNKIKFLYYGENGNFGKHKEVTTVANKDSKKHTLVTATKDLIPTLHGICKLDVAGKIKIYAHTHALIFKFGTDLANYTIAIPSSNVKGKRVQLGFRSYREVE